MMRIFSLLTVFLLTFSSFVSAQEDDLLSLLGEEETTDYTNASFKTNRVINLHSLENTAEGVLDFKISHRFNPVSNGFYDIFGLDGANIRFGLDYGLSDVITIGVGRSSLQKTYDGFVKYKFLRQSTGKKTMALTAALLLTSSINTLKWENPDRENYFSSRLAYTTQLILGRKFSDDIQASINRIKNFPNSYQKVSNEIRRCTLHRFPYNILYLFEEDTILIVAIAHQHRIPDYWDDRV